jgi:hypothetical protein
MVMQMPSVGRDLAKMQFCATNEEDVVRDECEKSGEVNCEEPPKMQDCSERPQTETEMMAPSDGTVLSKKLQDCIEFRFHKSARSD